MEQIEILDDQPETTPENDYVRHSFFIYHQPCEKESGVFVEGISREKKIGGSVDGLLLKQNIPLP